MEFIITDHGRTAAFNAGVAGIKIEVTEFRIGASFGYIPDPSIDTDLHGPILWTGVPTGFAVVDVDTCEFILEVPGNVGTFDFGEVGLYLNNGECFAISVLPIAQQKVAFPASGWNTIVIRARIQLVNVAAIIQWSVTNLTVGVIQELPNYSMLPRPMIAPSNAYIVHDADERENDGFVTRSGDETWDVSTHMYVEIKAGDFGPLVGSTASSVLIGAPVPIENIFPIGRYLIQAKTGLQKGLVRQVTEISGSRISWTPAFGDRLRPGDQFEILRSTVSMVDLGDDHGFFHALSVRSVS